MRLEDLNNLTPERCQAELMKCCGSGKWARKMTYSRPFGDVNKLLALAEQTWNACAPSDWLEAFSHHPKIGADKKDLNKNFESTKKWASAEQKGVSGAGEETLDKLSKLNEAYANKFGYLFIICATGKTADEMLASLQDRITHSPDDEIKIAMSEQTKITRLRLQKLLS